MVLEQKAGGAGAARWWGACTHTHKSEAQTSQHAQKAPSAAAAAAAEHRTPSAAQPSATARVRTRCRGQAPPLGAREFDGTRYRLAPSDELAPRDGPVAGAGAGAARRRADCPCSCAPPTGNFLGDSAIPQGLPEGISSHPTRALMARRTPPRNPSEGTLIHHATPCIAAQCTVSPIRVLRGRAKATAWWTTAAMRSRPSEICRHLLPAPYSWYNCQGIPEGFPVDAGMSTKIRSKSLIPLRPQRIPSKQRGSSQGVIMYFQARAAAAWRGGARGGGAGCVYSAGVARLRTRGARIARGARARARRVPRRGRAQLVPCDAREAGEGGTASAGARRRLAARRGRSAGVLAAGYGAPRHRASCAHSRGRVLAGPGGVQAATCRLAASSTRAPCATCQSCRARLMRAEAHGAAPRSAWRGRQSQPPLATAAVRVVCFS